MPTKRQILFLSSETEQLTSEAFCPDTVKKLRQIGDGKFARLAVFILLVRNIVFFVSFFSLLGRSGVLFSLNLTFLLRNKWCLQSEPTVVFLHSSVAEYNH